MATNRERRKNAGNKMAQLMNDEEELDEFYVNYGFTGLFLFSICWGKLDLLICPFLFQKLRMIMITCKY
jgi:hypothetical protein